RLSVVFALIVAALSTAFGVLYGALQGYFAGWTDIGMERAKEIWGALPVLYMLIIFASLFSPSFWLLVLLIAIFGWLGMAAYVRAEFLKNRTLDRRKMLEGDAECACSKCAISASTSAPVGWSTG